VVELFVCGRAEAIRRGFVLSEAANLRKIGYVAANA